MRKPFDAQPIFVALQRVYCVYQGRGIVVCDEPGRYFLATHEVRARDGYRTAFGGVEIRRSYVSAHLMPVYVHPDLLDGLPERLERRRHGKSCFNFSTFDQSLFGEFEALVSASFLRFEADGRFRHTDGV